MTNPMEDIAKRFANVEQQISKTRRSYSDKYEEIKKAQAELDVALTTKADLEAQAPGLIEKASAIPALAGLVDEIKIALEDADGVVISARAEVVILKARPEFKVGRSISGKIRTKQIAQALKEGNAAVANGMLEKAKAMDIPIAGWIHANMPAALEKEAAARKEKDANAGVLFRENKNDWAELAKERVLRDVSGPSRDFKSGRSTQEEYFAKRTEILAKRSRGVVQEGGVSQTHPAFESFSSSISKMVLDAMKRHGRRGQTQGDKPSVKASVRQDASLLIADAAETVEVGNPANLTTIAAAMAAQAAELQGE